MGFEFPSAVHSTLPHFMSSFPARISGGPYDASIVDEVTHRPRPKIRNELIGDDRTHLTLKAKAMNDLEVLEKEYSLGEKNRKILNILSKDWESKVTAIEEVRDLNSIPIESLVNSLTSYEVKLKSKIQEEEDAKVRKSIALKASHDEDDSASLDRDDVKIDDSVQEGLKKLTINDQDTASPENDSKEDDSQDSSAQEDNDKDVSTPNDLPKVWKFVQNHPKELIIEESLSVPNAPSGLEMKRMKTFRSSNLPPNQSRKRTGTRCGKTKQSAKKKQNVQTGEPSVEQIEEHHTEEHPVSDSEEELEHPTNAGASVTKSLTNVTESHSKREKVPTDQRSGKRKRSAKEQPEAQTAEEPVPLPKFIDDDGRRGLKGSRRKPLDNGKAPATEEETEEDDDEDTEEEEVDPDQFRLTRRRSGSSKITI
nr:glutamic acid-rich protein-like [Coffea arabica]